MYLISDLDGTSQNNNKTNIYLDKLSAIYENTNEQLKLGRICVENNGIVEDGENIQRLEDARIQNKLVTHKITKKHIQCDRNKMSVPLAALALSKSIANSLDYFMVSLVLTIVLELVNMLLCLMTYSMF